MTDNEKKAAIALQKVNYLPASFDKKFAHQLSDKLDKPMTEKGRNYMLHLLKKYRRQIADSRIRESILKDLKQPPHEETI